MDIPLPTGWTWKTLGDVCLQPQYGWTTSAATTGGLHLLRTTDISSGHIDWNTVPYCTEEPSDKEKYRLHDGDIVISRAGSVGFSHLIKNPKPAVFASYLIRFRPKANERFVAFFLQSPYYWQAISEKSIGIAIPNVNATKLKQIPIPIPPLPEQERIVARIESLFTQLDAGVAGLKHVQAALKRYKASVLKAACEGRLAPQDPSDEPVEEMLHRLGKSPQAGEYLLPLPQGWSWVTVGNIADHRLGKMLDKQKNKGELHPYIRNINVRWFEFDLSDIQYMRVLNSELENISLQKGDLVVCEGGEPGRAAVWNKDEPMIIQKALHRVRPVNGVLPSYLALCFAADANTGRLQKYFTGSTIKHFTGESLHSYIIPLPPQKEQMRIVAEVERRLSVVQELEQVVSASLKRSTRLRQSILKRAFEGQLLGQDRGEASANLPVLGSETPVAEAAPRLPTANPSHQLELPL